MGKEDMIQDSRPKAGFSTGQIITLANHKGGCGKTTNACSLAAGFAEAGYKTVLVDLDPQCNTTKNFVQEIDKLSTEGQRTALDMYMNEVPADRIVMHIEGRCSENLWFIPGHRALDEVEGALELQMKQNAFNEPVTPIQQDKQRIRYRTRLRRSLATLQDKYDLVVLDTPPNLGYVVTSAFIASNWYVIPVFASRYDTDGLGKLTSATKEVREEANPSLGLLAVIQGNFDVRTTTDNAIRERLKHQFPKAMCEAVIGQSVKHRNATFAYETIYEHCPNEKPAQQYRDLTQELLARLHDYVAQQGELASKRGGVDSGVKAVENG